MKIRIERNIEITPAGILVPVALKPCPYPKKMDTAPGAKVGSFACGRCGWHGGRTDDYVYCAAGDKRRRVNA